jgi:hypothetical protein
VFQIFPIKGEQLYTLFLGQALPPGALPFAQRLLSNGEAAGICLFYLLDGAAVFTKLEYPKEDMPLADALVRASLRFAQDRGAHTADFSALAQDEALRKFGFIEKSPDCRREIVRLFKDCENCEK